MNPPSKSLSSSSKSTKSKSLNRNCSIKIAQRTKQQQCSGNALKNLNTTTVNSSSNISRIEAPKDCLRFFHSHSSSSIAKSHLMDRPAKMKTLAKTTPKSAPCLSKPSKRSVVQKPSFGKAEQVKKNRTFLYQWQSGRKPSSRHVSKCKISSVLDTGGSPVDKLTSGSEARFCNGNDVDLTPSSKTATGSGLDFAVDKRAVVGDDEKLSNGSGSKNKTPPIQASVSPEIQAQCGSSITATSTTPACYSAGHVVSGITDKRKCRPRGVLTVGDNNVLDFGTTKAVDSFAIDYDNDEENVVRVVDNSRRVSIVPLPAEACVHWLLSPCNEADEEQMENSENGSCQFQIHSPSSCLFGDDFSLDLCNDSANKRLYMIARRTSNSLCSPSGVPEFEGISGAFHENVVISSSRNCTPSCKAADLEEECTGYDFDGENSPFSMDTLGSENVIQTPQSESSSSRYAGLSRLKTEAGQKHDFGSEIDLLTESIQMESLSSTGYESIVDPAGSSFQFDCMTTTPSNSVDLSQFQEVLEHQASWMSTSTSGNVSQSHMKISWREGLVGMNFEMDASDSCRYLSDEDEDVSGCDNGQLKSCHNPELNVDELNYEILKNDFGSTEDVDTEIVVKEKGEERFPSQITCSCAESISTDGGGLAASGDSDWTQCYKNHSFRI